MAMQRMDNPIDSRVSLNRSIPGQSLTSDPDNPWPWEKPPEFVNLDESLRYLLNIITQRDAYSSLMDMTAKGTPLMEISQVLLFQGFTEGKWNPDLMMILAEPLCYMLLALCERNDIDPIIYDGEDEDSDEEVQMFNVDMKKDKLRKLAEAARKDTIPAGVLPTEIKEDLENIEVASLLAQPDQAVEDDINSLLGRN
tara:strand:+ start:1180 stop:1770 length:591 start_codon:yes stop_codon:yes gene_type:complete